jgi:glycolate oxidase iron-sulfur subunit
MHSQPGGSLADTARGAIAAEVIGACVHCGLCNAACPTYRLTGDELDGPRGRLYLLKQAVEAEAVGAITQHHLDRCLECRACESACPSGVAYHRLYDIGRETVGEQVRRPAAERWRAWAIRTLVRWPWLTGALFDLARAGRGVLPRRLARLTPPKRPAGPWPKPAHGRRLLILGGCVQSAAAPAFNAATARVFDKLGVSLVERGGCCGAVDFHLGAGHAARARARRQIAALERDFAHGFEALVVNASGCAAFIRDWPDLLADEPAWADRARAVVARLKDPVEVLAPLIDGPPRPPTETLVALHVPCTLAHGPALGGAVEALLARLGYPMAAVAGQGQCCGSAGAYSLLQPEISGRLREERLAALHAQSPAMICTANIGCWMHLQAASATPVRHWIEAVEAAL